MTLPARGSAIEGEVIAPNAVAIIYSSSPFTSPQRLFAPPGSTIADAVDLLQLLPAQSRHLRAFIGEWPVERALWGRVRPKTPLYLRVEPGEPVKSIASAIVAFFKWMAAIPVVGSFLVNAVLTVAAAALYKALVPPPDTKNDWGFDQQPGNPYGQLTGIQNRIALYGPIPRVFGKRRLYPLIAARPYTETQGSRQFLRMLLLVGYGPLRISDLKIGDTPISAFPDSQYEIREGWPDDDPVTLYTKLIDEESLAILLSPSSAQTRSTATETTEISVDITFPNGLFRFRDDGKRENREVVFTVQYRATGSGGGWTNATWIDGKAEHGTATNGLLKAKAADASQVIRSGRFAVASGQWDVRITRTTAAGDAQTIDTAYWTVLRSIKQDAPVNMTGLCLIALRLKATEQLNGAPETINCVAESYLPVWDGETWTDEISRNPAWAYAHVLRKRGQTTLIPDHRIDLDAIRAWAEACDEDAPNAAEPRWQCDLVLEGGAVFTAAKAIAAHGRAQFAVVDGLYSVVRDVEQAVPVQHISPRNSHSYRGSKTFYEIPHALRCSFINPDRGYTQDEVIVYRDGYNADGSGGNLAATKFDSLDFPGCSSATQAWREGRYHLATLLLRPEEHHVSMDIDAIVCNKGDLVRFSYDVIAIGLGYGRVSRVIYADANTIVGVELDTPVAMELDTNYAIRIRLANGETGLYPVRPQVGAVSEVTFDVAIPASGGPAIGDLFQFGELGRESAPMIVKAIQPGEDLTWRVTMVDAQSGVYTADTGEIPAFNSHITVQTPPTQARPDAPSITVRSGDDALLRLVDGTIIERIEVALGNIAASVIPVARWEVEARMSGDGDSDYTQIAVERVATRSIFVSPVLAGDVMDVRARVISIWGVPSDWTVVSSHTVVGKSAAPSPPSGYTVTARTDGVLLSWTLSSSVDVVGYEVRYGGSAWDTGSTIVGVFAGPTAFVPITLSGAVTFRIKALDGSGLYSTEVTQNSPTANIPPPVGGGSGSGGVTSNTETSQSTGGTTHTEINRVALSSVAVGGRYRITPAAIAQLGSTALTSGATWTGQWEIIENATGANASSPVVAGGTLVITDIGGGDFDFDFDIFPLGYVNGDVNTAGARDLTLRVWRTSGSNDCSTFTSILDIEYIPPLA